jgi:hypothetical protein
VVTEGSPTIAFGVAPDIPSDVGATFECQINDEAFHPCTSPLVLSDREDGFYTVVVRVTDPVGNSATISRQFAIDRTITGGGTTPSVTGSGTTPSATNPGRKRIASTVTLYYDARRGGARVTFINRLRVNNVPRGARVTVFCRGQRCPFKRRTVSKSGAVSLQALFRGRGLRPRTTVEIRVTKSGRIGAVFVYKTRSGEPPTFHQFCLPAQGTTKPQAC